MVFDSVIGLDMGFELQISQILNGSVLNIDQLGQMLFCEFDDDFDLIELLEMAHLAAQFVDNSLDEFDFGGQRLFFLLYV